jgi:hypothetical protein
MTQLRTQLPPMLEHAGYPDIARQITPSRLAPTLDEVEAKAGAMAIQQHNTVRHNRGTDVIEAGNIRFGLEMRRVGQDGGIAIHVLGDIAAHVQERADLLGHDPGARSVRVNARAVQDGQAPRHADEGRLSDRRGGAR